MSFYNTKRDKLVKIFEDTIGQVRKDKLLYEDTCRMVAGTKVYREPYKGSLPASFDERSRISVVEDTTFSCARKLVKENFCAKVAVLNFANPVHPGGGVVRGAIAQEECLCRSSNLYYGLTCKTMMQDYYGINRVDMGDYGSDAVGYHPGVCVFKDDELFAGNLDKMDRFHVDVITCAAPRLSFGEPVDPDELFMVHVNRGRRILEAAILNGVDVLVLGAFGCGAFANDPEVVAKAYAYLLKNGYGDFFKKVVFAIKKEQNGVNRNYQAFQSVFRDYFGS